LDISRFKILKVVGKGAFSNVYKQHLKKKKLNQKKLNQKIKKRI
jgi:serine/threonine protein kinase